MAKLKSTEQFIAEATEKHGGFYTYNKTHYTGAKDKVVTTCKKHGEFLQTAGDHLSGKGCRTCANVAISKAMIERKKNDRVSLDNFISRANKVHKESYDYSYSSFTYTSDKVAIKCPKHGMFQQEVTKHLLGSRCPKCSNESTKNGWSTKDWKNAGGTSTNFSGFKLYIVKLYNDQETFYKVGKTFRDLSYKLKDVPYNFSVVSIVVSSAEYISNLETTLHTLNKVNKYHPNKAFCGVEECYSEVSYK